MYFLARFNGMIIIGQLHNSKTAARAQTRIGRSGPSVIRNYLHSPSLSDEGKGGGGGGEREIERTKPEIVARDRTRSWQKLSSISKPLDYPYRATQIQTPPFPH